MTTVTPFRISLKPLARKRRRLDVSQRQLAEWIGGMTGGCISNYEVGIRSVPLSFLVSAARSLGVPMWDLFEVHDVREDCPNVSHAKPRKPVQRAGGPLDPGNDEPQGQIQPSDQHGRTSSTEGAAA